MSRMHPKGQQSRFSGGVRHYHRSNAAGRRSWDDWVEGPGRKGFSSFKWLKLSGIALAVLVLLGIIAALFIEMS